jgi:hemolysin III
MKRRVWIEIRTPPISKSPERQVNVFDLREPVSSASHLLTAVWAVFATLLMLRLSPSGRRWPVAVFGMSMVLLYLASGLFHGVRFSSDGERWFYSRLDHSAIYLLIAGTNTPALVILLSGAWRRWCLRLVWGLALAGFMTMWLFPKPPHALNISFFLGLGWLGAAPVVHYYRAVGWRAMNWVWVGAACYSIGAVCELTKWPTIIEGYVQAHEVMHIFDTAASMAFFVFAVKYVIQYPASLPAEAIPQEQTEVKTQESQTSEQVAPAQEVEA